MYEIIGVKQVDFTGKDGKRISGFSVWAASPVPYGEGVKADKFFITDAVSNRSNFYPHVGDAVEEFCFDQNGRLRLVLLPQSK